MTAYQLADELPYLTGAERTRNHLLGMQERAMQREQDNPGVLIFPPLLFGIAVVAVLTLNWLWPLVISHRAAALPVGVALSLVAIGLIAWGRKTMALAGTNVNPSLPSTVLVSSGPFSFSRNPLYLGLCLLLLGVSLALGSWWGVVTLVPVGLVLHYGVVLREEHYLEGKFGESYRQYKAGVRRYL